MKHCKCKHPITTHLGGAGPCTAIGCACDEYVAQGRVISDEARQLIAAIAKGDEGAAQDALDQRDAWQREAAKLLAQRDYAERRTNELEARFARTLDEMTEVVDKSRRVA